MGSGPYLVFPILGPSTLRDGFGGIIDRAFHPLTYTLAFPVQLVWGGGAGFARRDAVSDAMQAMEESSVDFYAVLRSAYMQERRRAIEALRDEPEDAPASTSEPGASLASGDRSL